MDIPYETLLYVCDFMEDSRGLYLVCWCMYDNCSDKLYWKARGHRRLAMWLPKIKIKHNAIEFARVGNLAMIKHLIPRDINVIETPDLASMNFTSPDGRLNVISYLSVINESDASAIVDAACYYGHLDVVKHLISVGFDVTTGTRCLCTAIRRGHVGMMKYLVAIGADVNAYDNCAIRVASACGHLKAVKFLVSRGADVIARGNGAIKWAQFYRHSKVVKYLLSVGASL